MPMTDLTDLLNDPPAFFREMARRKEQAARVADARPKYKDVGQIFDALTRAYVHTLWGPDVAETASFELLVPISEGAGAGDGGVCPTVNPNNRLVLEIANGYATGLRDHLLGFVCLAVNGAPARPMLALSRVVLDAAAHLLHLLSPNIAERERIARALNIRLEAFREEINDHAQGSTEQDELSEERSQLMAQAVADGFERESRRSKTGVESPSWYVVPRHRLDDIMEEALQGEHLDAWRTLSSAVHVQERPDLRFSLGLNEFQPGPDVTLMNMVHMARPLITAIEAMKAVEWYYGRRGPGVEHDGLAQHALNVVAAACGMFDDTIRARLRLE